MLVSVLTTLGPLELISTWQPGTPIVVEVNGEPYRTVVTRVSRGVATDLYLQVDLPVPAGTPVQIGRHRKL